MAKIDYDKVKALILEKHPDLDVDSEVKEVRSKLATLSREGALLIVANKKGVTVKTSSPKATIKTISQLRKEDDYVEIAGVIVSTYELRFYEVCSECAKRVRQDAGAWKCEKHGVVNPAFSFVFNILVDDGTENVRVTLFSRQMEKMLGMSTQQILKFREKPESFEEIKNDLLGKQMAFRGKVRLDEYSQRKEFTCKLVFTTPKDVEPRIEAVSNLISHSEKIPDTEEDDIETTEELVI